MIAKTITVLLLFFPFLLGTVLADYQLSSPGATFTNTTFIAGVSDNGDGRGPAFIDYNNDGDLDIFLANMDQVNVLYQNNGDGTFTNIALEAHVGDLGNGRGGVFGDYDNDGDKDLYVVKSTGSNIFYRNKGDGTFTEITSSAGVEDQSYSISAIFGDYDLDGYLDLYVVNFNHEPNLLYHNNGNGTFTEVGSVAGVDNPGMGEAAIFGDVDNDGDIDLLVTNAGGGTSNAFYRNNGNGTFTDDTINAGLWDMGFSRGIDLGDYDNDGFLDIYIGRIGQPNLLYHNNGDGTFTEVGQAAGVAHSGQTWSVVFGDYDNDGFLDIYVAQLDQPNLLYHNNGDGTFTDVGQAAGVNDNGISAGAAFGDYNNDGFLDIYVVNNGTNTLYQNNGNNNNWLKVKTIGNVSNRDGIGARIIINSGSLSQIREVRGGRGIGSQDCPPVEFGLGSAASVDQLKVQWPSGIFQSFKNIAANQLITLREDFPVTLSYFLGLIGNNKLLLVWRTEKETNNSYWNIFRREEGSSHYLIINKLKIRGKGSSNTPHIYSYLDNKISASKTYYYFLEAVAQDGTIWWSPIIKITSSP